MNLSQRIAALAARIGLEVRSKANATHPGLARAWACFGWTGTAMVLRSAHNVASVSRLATGRYRIHFAAAMPDAHYCWSALARSSTDSGTMRLAIVRSTSDQKTPQHVDVCCATAASATFSDSTEINLIVYR